MAAASFFVMMFFDVLSSLVALIFFLFLTFQIFDLLFVLISFHGLVFLWLSVQKLFVVLSQKVLDGLFAH